MMDRALTLSELNMLVKQAVELTLDSAYWVQAELAGVSESRGHCYMELVECGDDGYGFQTSRTPVAQARACCWRNTWERLRPRFERATGQEMRRGMKVLLKVRANFHVAYGFSWIVENIDPTYTMGDMARKRQAIIAKLKEEGVIDLNKTLKLSPFARRIAVVSSATAAGYGDFCSQLNQNEYGFPFYTKLFPAIMQGEQVEATIISALNGIYDALTENPEAFDVVVIIRGGGSTSDLSGFDTLALAENVANFPLPVITGIGHERDQSVLDLVACHSVKTPTAVAAMLIDNLAVTLRRVEDASLRINKVVGEMLEREKLCVERMEQRLAGCFGIRKLREERRILEAESRLKTTVNRILLTEHNRQENIIRRLPMALKTLLDKECHRLAIIEQRANALDPVNILKRGYSITLREGKAVTDASMLKKGNEVTVVMAKGRSKMIVSE